MKKLYNQLILFTVFIIVNSSSVKATIHDIEVEDFEFNPTTLIVNVGDTIHWYWEEGFHTTTSFLIPAGAATWDQPIFSSSPTFDYVVTVAGSYDYICSPHASMGMTGHFTAIGTTGINEQIAPSLAIMGQHLQNGILEVFYAGQSANDLYINVYDLAGKLIISESFKNDNAGLHSRQIYIGHKPTGVYILEVINDRKRIARKLVSE